MEHLQRVLALEAQRGCDNHAAVGSTDGIVLAWLEPAAKRAKTTATRRKLSALLDAWENYRRTDRERRARIVAATDAVLDGIGKAEGLIGLGSPVSALTGIGVKRAFEFSMLGILTVHDLLLNLPLRYIDASATAQVAEVEDGASATVDVVVKRVPQAVGQFRKTRAEARAGDETGEVLLVWFGQPYRALQVEIGDRLRVMGRAQERGGRRFFIVSKTLRHVRSGEEAVAPEIVDAAEAGLEAEYADAPGLPSKIVREAVAAAMEKCGAQVVGAMPAAVAEACGALQGEALLRALHLPKDEAEYETGRRSLATERLFLLQTRLLRQKRRSGPSPVCRVDAVGLAEEIGKLARVRLTGAQTRVIGEIEADLRAEEPAHRLIHGDVGCGKTLVAAAALMAAARTGRQAAIMAPTEMLAEQHFLRLRELMEGADVHLVTGSLPAAQRGPAMAAAEAGHAGVWVGTHALIQERMAFRDLAVVVVDEQHRFGVAQRAVLAAKGAAPNFLAMSATPIPRTLALALYADFDLSVIDEMPPGRQAVTTKLVTAGRQDAAYRVLREKVEGGEQGFVVCPLIDPSPVLDAEAAAELYETLAAGPLEGLTVGLVHGRMATPERQAVMGGFYEGEIGVLVSTTVIEVGLDVPNASVILVQNAERFGLAQLHQLRGRVARSRHRPLCVLVSGRGGETSNERLRVLAATNDGFRIAEADLLQRGAGELAGLRQHGLGDGIVADVLKHPELLAQARAEAAKVLEADPDLARPENRALAEVVAEMGELEEGRWAL